MYDADAEPEAGVDGCSDVPLEETLRATEAGTDGAGLGARLNDVEVGELGGRGLRDRAELEPRREPEDMDAAEDASGAATCAVRGCASALTPAVLELVMPIHSDG